MSDELDTCGFYIDPERDWNPARAPGLVDEKNSCSLGVPQPTNAQSNFPDVEDVKFVINFDYPCNSEDYVHRIGRTGRSQRTGTAYTFFTPQNSNKAADLVAVLKEAKQVINPKLQDMAEHGGQGGGRSRWRRGGGGGGGGRNGRGGPRSPSRSPAPRRGRRDRDRSRSKSRSVSRSRSGDRRRRRSYSDSSSSSSRSRSPLASRGSYAGKPRSPPKFAGSAQRTTPKPQPPKEDKPPSHHLRNHLALHNQMQAQLAQQAQPTMLHAHHMQYHLDLQNQHPATMAHIQQPPLPPPASKLSQPPPPPTSQASAQSMMGYQTHLPPPPGVSHFQNYQMPGMMFNAPPPPPPNSTGQNQTQMYYHSYGPPPPSH
ncbi:hypothetical protein HUJ04_001160 [Dendroctonus ponderosae]|nr:hypothetical protein HUJ04_001160 [Dendroctonus ponderosae]KAH1018194.1 hypothetical protein HUJ05_006008 [Dendroctonus ponderosae]KAH1018195.1 hypothetical protein HUJ05_006008 [Dendroctonus ponderosae]